MVRVATLGAVLSVLSGIAVGGCTDENRESGSNAEGGIVSVGGQPGPDSDASTGVTAGTATSGLTDGEGSGSGETVGTTGIPSDDSGDSGPLTFPKFDVGVETTGIECTTCNQTCTAVDLLFIVDNSGSMADEQEALSEAFPDFANAILTALPEGVSLHVGVTSTEMAVAGSTVTECDEPDPTSVTAAYVTPEVMNTGRNGAQGRLYEANGLPFFEISTDAPPDEVAELEAWFTAAANIGENGSSTEMALAGAGWAFHPANDAVNAGFVRDEDAVLVLFFIQDERDQTPPAESTALIQNIVDAKTNCGGMECVVGGGFVANCNGPSDYPAPIEVLFSQMAQPPVRQELPSNVVAADYIPLLTEALAQVIVDTCGDIGPEG
jgi:hypothetical protein